MFACGGVKAPTHGAAAGGEENMFFAVDRVNTANGALRRRETARKEREVEVGEGRGAAEEGVWNKKKGEIKIWLTTSCDTNPSLPPFCACLGPTANHFP